MRRFDAIDKITLFLSMSFLYAMQTTNPFNVSVYIIVVICVGLLTYLDHLPHVSLGIGLVYAGLCIFDPTLCFFLPLIAYALYSSLPSSWIFLLAVVFLSMWLRLPSEALFLSALTFLVLILKKRTLQQVDLKQHLVQALDASRELSLNMKRQNQSLIEKQDQELRGATLDERNRIAREIHDNVGHQLSSALMQVGALLVKDFSNQNLLQLKETLNHAMDNIRSSVHNLYDDSIDLDTQLDKLVRSFTFCKIQSTLQYDSLPPTKIKFAVIAILKEALSNVMKHSNATLVRISFIEHPGFYQLIIADNGTLKSTQTDTGIGLNNIAHRIEALSGNFLIRKSTGFELFMTIPKEISP